eukprot:9926143-Alexandrium_andersonii.AAC.1
MAPKLSKRAPGLNKKPSAAQSELQDPPAQSDGKAMGQASAQKLMDALKREAKGGRGIFLAKYKSLK